MVSKFLVHITRTVEDDLKDLEPYQKQVIRELLVLERDLFKSHALKGTLRSLRSLEFSLPGGACRAVYAVKKKERVCLIVIVGYHENFYRRAERRIKALRRNGII